MLPMWCYGFCSGNGHLGVIDNLRESIADNIRMGLIAEEE